MLVDFINNNGYQDLVEYFTEEKIISRFDFLKANLESFIIENKLENDVKISIRSLEHIITDYYVDIARLKGFQGMQLVNDIKIFSYLSFWILRHKPLQVLNDENTEYDMAFINEEFVTVLLCSFLFKNPDNIPFVSEKKADIDEFCKTLKYYFSYREYSAQSIELALLAFEAGRAYQYSVDYQGKRN